MKTVSKEIYPKMTLQVSFLYFKVSVKEILYHTFPEMLVAFLKVMEPLRHVTQTFCLKAIISKNPPVS